MNEQVFYGALSIILWHQFNFAHPIYFFKLPCQ